MEIIGYIASVFIGIVLGILGGGGSILSIPILVYLFHIEPVLASAYSLFIVGATSLVGAIPKYRDHLVNLKTGFVFGVPSVLAIFSTRKWIVPSIPDVIFTIGTFEITRRILLLGIFALLMIIASVTMIRGKHDTKTDDHTYKTLLLVIEGILIGLLTGLVGAGGGFLIIPALVLLTGLPFKTAVGTSLFIIAINSLMGFIGDVLTHQIDWFFLVSITLLAVVGIFIGNQLQKLIPALKLRKAFGVFILGMGIYILSRELFL